MITVLFSDPKHPALTYVYDWCKFHGARLVHHAADLEGGDVLFLVSCTEVLQRHVRDRYRRVLVIHESALPQGRGWSPLAWQILEGKNDIPITVLEAADKVDAGVIVAQGVAHLEGHELADEIHEKVAREKLRLMEMANPYKPGVPQEGEPTYYRRRTPEDSRLDPNKTIAEQFDLLRICEPRFPAFFEHRGHIYEVTLTKREGERSANS